MSLIIVYYLINIKFEIKFHNNLYFSDKIITFNSINLNLVLILII